MAFQYKLRSVVVLGAMYALLFAILYVVNLLYWQFSELIVVGIALGFLLLQYLISPFILKWIYRIHWLSPEDVKHYHPNLANIIDQVVRKYDIKPPTFGIIHDLSPNAFTFGWTKNSANIVITDGILDLLDEDEQTSVVAHELGHIVHNDFIVMTVASAIPILFYTIFRMLL